MIEKQTKKFIKRLKTKNGREFIPQTFTKICTKNGIIWQFMQSYTPQQNKVVQRRNRFILDKA